VQALISLREEPESVESMLMGMLLFVISLYGATTSPQAVDKNQVALPFSPIFHTVKNPGRETEGNPVFDVGN
jgi:hypothetical protein